MASTSLEPSGTPGSEWCRGNRERYAKQHHALNSACLPVIQYDSGINAAIGHVGSLLKGHMMRRAGRRRKEQNPGQQLGWKTPAFCSPGWVKEDGSLRSALRHPRSQYSSTRRTWWRETRDGGTQARQRGGCNEQRGRRSHWSSWSGERVYFEESTM